MFKQKLDVTSVWVDDEKGEPTIPLLCYIREDFTDPEPEKVCHIYDPDATGHPLEYDETIRLEDLDDYLKEREELYHLNTP